MLGRSPLTLWGELRKLGLLSKNAPSSNGKTADSGSVYRGSNPCGAATSILDCGFWILDCYSVCFAILDFGLL
jgi:hypothetical protein